MIKCHKNHTLSAPKKMICTESTVQWSSSERVQTNNTAGAGGRVRPVTTVQNGGSQRKLLDYRYSSYALVTENAEVYKKLLLDQPYSYTATATVCATFQERQSLLLRFGEIGALVDLFH